MSNNDGAMSPPQALSPRVASLQAGRQRSSSDAGFSNRDSALYLPRSHLVDRKLIKLQTLMQNWIENPVSTLTFENEKIGSKGIKYLCTTLEECQATELKVLNFAGNNIGKKGIEAISDLYKNTSIRFTGLDLSDNDMNDDNLKDLVALLDKDTHLKSLKISANSITLSGARTLAAFLMINNTLHQLDLSCNRLGQTGIRVIADSAFRDGAFIAELNLSQTNMDTTSCISLGNALREIFASKRAGTFKLKSLDISGNNISDEGLTWLTSCLRENRTIIHWNLSDNGATDKSASDVAGEFLSKMSPIRSLNLSRNKLDVRGAQSLATSICNPASLTRLHLSGCDIKTTGANALFKALGSRLSSIIDLDLSKNSITDDCIGHLNNMLGRNKIEKFNISHNQFATLGRIGEVLRLNTLKELYLSYNKLSDPNLGEELSNGLHYNTSLVILEAKGTDMSQDSIEKISQSYNSSNSLSHCILNNVDLTSKERVAAGLTFIPNNWLFMTNLRSINLSDNKISEVPSTISQLIHLRDLNLANNLLQTLPQSLALLRNTLRTLNLDGNEMKTPPKEIVRRGVKEILGYLTDLSEGSESCYRIKVMMVGQENVGKTTLLNALRKTPIAQDISTDGIEIDDWSLKVTIANKKPVKVKVKTMDFAGQQLYYSTHQFFLSQRSIYVLVFDLRYPEDDSRLEFWLYSIKVRSPNVPVIIVGTHADDKKCTQDYMTEVLTNIHDKFSPLFKNIVEYISVDATKSVDILKNKLRTLIAQQPTMGESIPRAYLELERILLEERATRTPPIMSWDDYRKIGQLASIHDDMTLERATQFFHDLGTLVYFGDKRSNLKDLVILDPHFIVQLLRTVVSTTKLNWIRDGLLLAKDLPQIWRPPEFDPQYYGTFLNLLETFEICHNLDRKINTDSRFLIPVALLNPEPPDLDKLWPPFTAPRPKQLDRWFRLSFVPSGFMARLMIRMFHWSVEITTYWSSGALMVVPQRDVTEKLLIRLCAENKTVQISVRGDEVLPMKTSRLAINTVRALIENWYHIEMNETVPCKHCLSLRINPPHEFELRDCSLQCATGKKQLTCPNEGAVALQHLVPDIAMVDIPISRIDFSEIEIKEALGRGAFGVIYDASYEGKAVAVKQLIVVNDTPDTAIQLFSEFRHEVWLMANLRHPNVVNLRGYCLNPYALVMEKVSEGPLYTFLHSSATIDWNLRMRIAVDIAQGMNFLHTQTPPILHRDLKTPNILMYSTESDSEVVAKVADFGTSMQLFISALKEKKDRTIVLPNWLAPEMMNQDEYTEKSDVYSFGVILWELQTRLHPYNEYTFMSALEDAVLAGKRPEIPTECVTTFRNLIEDCWQPDPERRPTFKVILSRLVDQVIPDVAPNAKQHVRFWTIDKPTEPPPVKKEVVLPSPTLRPKSPGSFEKPTIQLVDAPRPLSPLRPSTPTSPNATSPTTSPTVQRKNNSKSSSGDDSRQTVQIIMKYGPTKSQASNSPKSPPNSPPITIIAQKLSAPDKISPTNSPAQTTFIPGSPGNSRPGSLRSTRSSTAAPEPIINHNVKAAGAVMASTTSQYVIGMVSAHRHNFHSGATNVPSPPVIFNRTRAGVANSPEMSSMVKELSDKTRAISIPSDDSKISRSPPASPPSSPPKFSSSKLSSSPRSPTLRSTNFNQPYVSGLIARTLSAEAIDYNRKNSIIPKSVAPLLQDPKQITFNHRSMTEPPGAGDSGFGQIALTPKYATVLVPSFSKANRPSSQRKGMMIGMSRSRGNTNEHPPS
ncbi:hypothetical protein PROFUN_11723 [Planoprotostelium fungivorum]|uniref:non-specific serine/threonine protein kinase n=1 Tax=Planoprotostelium fungivorum TaxID=1890364 RepID=A0A2P6N986_9EUKA|nr:hypothetical protein PROFUN_11723 [Planoprotostelium fungivorum]